MILDKAGWHRSKEIQLEENIKLMYLAPHSPELNPVELLWREIRRKYFHNRIFNTLDDVEHTLNTALSDYHKAPNAVKNLSSGYIRI